jgi:hypothetical protein
MTERQKFKIAIILGTGEAHYIIKENPQVDFSNDIIKAALTNYVYDAQCEGSRGKYIFELIELSNKEEKIRQAILAGLATERTDTWALVQLFDLAAQFAKQGDKEARKAIYKRFYKKVIPGSEWAGQEAIIELDGLEGLKHIAEVKGKVLQQDPEEWEDSHLVDYFQEENPTIKVYDELNKAAQTNSCIKAYLDAILENKSSSAQRERPVYDYELVTERINSNATVLLPLIGVQQISEEDIKRLANDFLKEKSRLRLEKYLRIFDDIKFPYSYQPILELAKRKVSSKDRLPESAVHALRHFTGKDIRDFALYQITKAKWPGIYTNLLIANFERGDGKLLKSLVDNTKNEHKMHDLAISVIDIFKANKTAECLEPLVALYGKLTCGIHRADLVETLIENGVLPEKIIQEIQYDSYEDTRMLYQDKKWLRNKEALDPSTGSG